MQLSSLNLALSSLWQTDLGMQARSILYKYGADAHVYLPGIGTVSGLTAGNYLDSAGTTAATVDNPVGLSLDALQAMTLGANLAPATHAAFNGTINQASIPITCTSTASGVYGFQDVSLLTLGETYRVDVSWTGNTSGRVLYGDQAGTAILGFSLNGSGGYVFRASASANSMIYAVGAAGAGESFTVTSYSIVKIPGIHASQATTANKPILRRGLLNRLLQSNDFSTSNKATINLTTGIADPFGGTSATTLTATAANSEIWKWAAVTAGNYTSALWIRRKTGSGTVSIRNSANSVWIPLTLTSSFQLFVNDGGAVPDPAYVDLLLATSGDEIDVCRAGIFQGTLTAQQIIDAGGIPLTTSAAASSATGKYWWQLDGTDSLSLSAPLFQMSDDHCVIAGAKVESMAGFQTVFSEEGTGRIQIRYQAGTVQFLWLGASTGTNFQTSETYANTPIVIAARNSAGTKTSWINGEIKNTDSTATDTPNMTAANIGCWVSSNYMLGHLYPIIAIKGTVSDSDLLTLERFVGQLSGVSI